MDLYTIGHSNHPIELFIRRLLDRGVKQLVDVRSTPYSRFNPQFNKVALQQAFLRHGIEYVYAGTELGRRPRDPSLYIHHAIPRKNTLYLHEVSYPEVMKRPWFIQGIQGLLELAGKLTTSIMCSEADPALCHRHHLIARYLMEDYPEVTILHIQRDGSAINAKSIRTAIDKTDPEQLPF